MRRSILLGGAGAVFALVLLVSVRPDWVRAAWAAGPQALYSAAMVDDAAFTPATSAVLITGAEFDDAAPDSVNEGDGGAVRMSSRRELYVQIRDAAGNERGLNVDAAGAIATTISSSALLEVQGDQLTPVTTTVACDDTGAIAHTFDATAVYADIWNSSAANDVCVLWGTTGTPDRTNRASCAVILGADAGSGTSEVFRTPSTARIGSEAFECDAAAASTVIVTEWRTQ